jgi:hypothetical protein
MRKRIIFDLIYAFIMDRNQWQNARENSTMDIEKRKKLLLLLRRNSSLKIFDGHSVIRIAHFFFHYTFECHTRKCLHYEVEEKFN